MDPDPNPRGVTRACPLRLFALECKGWVRAASGLSWPGNCSLSSCLALFCIPFPEFEREACVWAVSLPGLSKAGSVIFVLFVCRFFP